jgi:HAD superfamily hydrolase (TIGR01484 family)
MISLFDTGVWNARKKVFIFDLDGTLTESRSPIAPKTAELLTKLLVRAGVAVISGGNYQQFETQLLSHLPATTEEFKKMIILPTSGARMYTRADATWDVQRGTEWKEEYEFLFSPAEKQTVLDAFKKAYGIAGYTIPEHVYGSIIEDRGSQITFSAVGQFAPKEEKEKWNRVSNGVRIHLRDVLEEMLPEFDVAIGGMTSIDITKKGINKAFGITQVLHFLHTDIADAVYVGDKLFEGGNDAAALETGIDGVQVASVADTEEFIRGVLSVL